MFKFVIVALTALVASAAAGVVSPLAYANAPLYAAGGSSQVDIRNNYDGTLSSYATAPFGYAGPYSSRYVAGAPAAYAAAPAAVARYSAAAPLAAPFSPYAAPAAFAAPAAYAAGPYGAATPFAAAATPFAAASPYFASPYGAAPAPVVF